MVRATLCTCKTGPLTAPNSKSETQRILSTMIDTVTPQDNQSGKRIQIPTDLILSFFNEAKTRLTKYPNADHQLQLLTDRDGNGELIPVSLESQRSFLLEEQVATLKACISEYNSLKDKIKEVEMEEVQDCLRDLGQNIFTKVSMDDNQLSKGVILKAMTEMNNTARSAFARSVLWAETEFSKHMLETYPLNEDGFIDYEKGGRNLLGSDSEECNGMVRSAAIEFSGLCTVAVHLPEVKRHLKTGADIFNESNGGSVSQDMTPQHRILQFQQMMLCAVGYEPKFGGEQLRMLMMKDDISEDSDLFKSLSEYVVDMQEVAKFALPDLPEHFSDENEGGVTRIVSVEHKEKMLNEKGEWVDSQGSAPSSERMRNDETINENTLNMVQKASLVQSKILSELLSMDKDTRNAVLKEASEANESFIKEIMALPPGPDRVKLMQNIGEERQSLLLRHKLWQQHLSKLNTEKDVEPSILE